VALLAKTLRDRRKGRREALRNMSPEDQKVAEALEKKRIKEEKENVSLVMSMSMSKSKIQGSVFFSILVY